MSLTAGRGPFGHAPAGRFNFEVPADEVMFVDPSPRRIRAFRGGEAAIDSRRVKMLHRIGVRPSSRHLVISVGGVPIAETSESHVLFETSLPPRWYMPREHVLAEL